MKEIIGVCSICKGNVIRETSLDVDDECADCGAIRRNYLIDMELPSPTAKPVKTNVYNHLEDDIRTRSVLDCEHIYNMANC